MPDTFTLSVAAAGLAAITAVFVAGKCLFLAGYPAGRLMVLANVFYEIVERKLHCSRARLDAILWPSLSIGFGLCFGSTAAAVAALGLGAVWVWTLHVDAAWKSGRLARQLGELTGRVPLPVPRLIVAVRGPVLDRRHGLYDAGDWPEGLQADFEVQILNPSPVCSQLPVTVHIESTTPRIEVGGTAGNGPRPGPRPGEVIRVRFSLRACRSGGGGAVQIAVRHGDFTFARTLRMRSIIPRGGATVCGARIARWKHGARAAFVWRGDQDLYDPATFQSEEGLRIALGLARRFRMPSSLMLSARLSLDPAEQQSFCAHFGWDRKGAEIPDFARFLRDEVDTNPEQEWPTSTERPFSAEIGNHLYLHYGTHAAADPANGWKSHARIGEGNYPWLSRYPADSFVEQRDNALQGSRVLRETLGVNPASYTIPGDVWDASTARAMEAAGLEVGSETDATKLTKLLGFPPPHHPAGCDRFVELTRMHPRDPENAFQLAMLKYWVGAARRTGRALVFLAHHHLALYEGQACYRLTEELLRHVLADQEGDVYAGTLTAVGRYWRDVLSERTRCIRVSQDGNRVTVANDGPRPLEDLPLELTLAGGRRHLRLVTVPASSALSIEV